MEGREEEVGGRERDEWEKKKREREQGKGERRHKRYGKTVEQAISREFV